MSDAPLHELWARFVAGETLLPEEERALLEALRRDPSLAGDAEVDGLLRALQAERREDEAFVRSVADCLEAERDVDLFVEDVKQKIAKGPRPTRRATRHAAPLRPDAPPAWGRWVAAAAAAAIFLAILAFFRTGGDPIPPRREMAKPALSPEPEPEPSREIERERIVPAPTPDPVRPDPVPTPPAPAPQLKPAPAPPPPPAPKPPTQEKVEPARTVLVAARIDKVEGDVFVSEISGRSAVKAGDALPAGAVIETVGAKSAATLLFADRTRLELAGDTLLRDVAEAEAKPPRGKRVTVDRGAVTAEVAKQTDPPMTFTTPHGEARVLGTILKLSVNGGTRLDVIEGRVSLKRKSDAKTVTVGAGQFAVAAPGRELAVRPVALERKILLQLDFETPNAQKDWELGTLDATQTYGGSKGALKAVSAPSGFFTLHAETAYMAKPYPFPITERTTFSFAYYATAHPGQIKVQFRANRSTTKGVIAFILDDVKVREWTVVTVRMADAFKTKAGTGEPIKPLVLDVDDLQIHAGVGGKVAELYLDNIVISE